jgi:lipopolysaccharide export system permease protein
MTILTRYIAGQTLAALTLILGSLTGIVWIAVALRQLRIVSSNGADAMAFFMLTTLAIPNLVGFVAPIALLIATLHVLNRLNGDSELIILTAAGGRVWWIMRPLIALAIGVSVLVTAINFYAMPQSLRMARELITEIRADLMSQVLQPGQFSNPEDNVTIHVRDRAINGELRGILFHDARNPKDVVSVAANRGRIVKSDGAPFLLLLDGHIIRQKTAVGPGEVIRFERYGLELQDFERKTGPVFLKPRERFLNELVDPNPDDALFNAKPGAMRAELHERFSNPLYPLAFVLIAIASIGQAQSTRTGRTQALVTGFVVAALLRLLGLTANNLVKLHEWAIPLLYLIPIFGIISALVALQLNARPRPGPSLQQKLFFAIEDAIVAARARLGKGRKQTVPAE